MLDSAYNESVIALVPALLVIFAGIANSFANDLGFVWRANNVLAITATIVFTMISFGVIPSVLLRKNINVKYG